MGALQLSNLTRVGRFGGCYLPAYLLDADGGGVPLLSQLGQLAFKLRLRRFELFCFFSLPGFADRRQCGYGFGFPCLAHLG